MVIIFSLNPKDFKNFIILSVCAHPRIIKTEFDIFLYAFLKETMGIFAIGINLFFFLGLSSIINEIFFLSFNKSIINTADLAAP